MKISIIGAGSTYTPELIEGIINRATSLDISELFLYDINERKLSIVGTLAIRMVEKARLKCRVVLTGSLEDTLTNSNFVLCQIRVGMLNARILDEKIPLKYNLLGQETMGIGGFFKALRTVPVIMDIVHKMEKLCPNAFLINFANPSGIVTQAVLNNSSIKMLGLCNVPYNMKKSITEKLCLNDPEFDYIGLNHLSWITGIRENGVDYLQKALHDGINSESMKNIPLSTFPPELIQSIGGIPSPYLGYIYFKDKKLNEAKEAELCRGEKCLEIENQLLELYSNSELKEKPKQLESRGGANYSLVAISLVDAIYNDKKETHVVNLLNNGVIDFLESNDAIETSAVIGKNGAMGIPLKNFNNEHIQSQMELFKHYERFTVEAALTGSREKAICALLANPLIYDYNKATDCFEEMLKAHDKYLTQGW